MVWQIDLNAANKRSLRNLTTVLANGWTDIWIQALFSHSPFRGSMCGVWLRHQSPYLALLYCTPCCELMHIIFVSQARLYHLLFYEVWHFDFLFFHSPKGRFRHETWRKESRYKTKASYPKKSHVISCWSQGVSVRVCVSSRRLSSCTW